jgi:hypothetical protein
MIVVTIKYSGTFVDRPNVKVIEINEDTPAMEKTLPNGKNEKITVGQLFRIFLLKKSYIPINIELEDQLTPEHFEIWFREKYLKHSSIYEKIISMDYSIR